MYMYFWYRLVVYCFGFFKECKMEYELFLKFLLDILEFFNLMLIFKEFFFSKVYEMEENVL